MYDIEVIGDQSYAVITEGSPAHEFLKAMNTQLVMKKLAGEEVFLDTKEVSQLCRGFRVADLKRLVDVGLLRREFHFQWMDGTESFLDLTRTGGQANRYLFTDYGLEVMAHIREHGGDVEILL